MLDFRLSGRGGDAAAIGPAILGGRRMIASLGTTGLRVGGRPRRIAVLARWLRERVRRALRWMDRVI
jgi:hypothetical protein